MQYRRNRNLSDYPLLFSALCIHSCRHLCCHGLSRNKTTACPQCLRLAVRLLSQHPLPQRTQLPLRTLAKCPQAFSLLPLKAPPWGFRLSLPKALPLCSQEDSAFALLGAKYTAHREEPFSLMTFPVPHALCCLLSCRPHDRG